MVNKHLDDLFSAMAHPTRRDILDRLRSGDRAISELAEPYDMTLPAVSKHIRVLEDAGLIRIRREGRVRVCRLEAEPLLGCREWIARFAAFWRVELDQLERYLADGGTGSSGAPERKGDE